MENKDIQTRIKIQELRLDLMNTKMKVHRHMTINAVVFTIIAILISIAAVN